jgi:hypothetical protein
MRHKNRKEAVEKFEWIDAGRTRLGQVGQPSGASFVTGFYFV